MIVMSVRCVGFVGIGVLAALAAGPARAGELPWLGDGDPVVRHEPHPTGGPASDTEFIYPFPPFTSWQWIADGDPIVSHPPTRGGGTASDTDFQIRPGLPFWQRVADEVLLEEPATVRRIVWWGFYDLDNPPATETMRVRFYDARPADGLPGNVLFEEQFLNLPRTATGARVPGSQISREYAFVADLARVLVLQAEVSYWLEIVQLGEPDTFFWWEGGYGDLKGYAFINPIVGEWRHTINTRSDLAFELLSIPEPKTVVLLFIGGALAVIRRRSGTAMMGKRGHD